MCKQPQDETVVFHYKFYSWIPFRFQDLHSFLSPVNGVFVDSKVLAGKVARNKNKQAFSFIPAECYTLLEKGKQNSLTALCTSLYDKLEKVGLDQITEEETQALSSLQTKLIERVGSTAIEEAFSQAITKLLGQIAEIQQNQQLSQSDKDFFIAQIRSAAHTFFQNQLRG